MAILTDKQIGMRCTGTTPMIAPFLSEQLKDYPVADEPGRFVRGPSSGLSSTGYDIRLAGDELKLFTNVYGAEIDPLALDIEKCFVTPDIKVCARTGARYTLLPPNSYLLGKTVETFDMPRDITGVCVGKSTLARAATLVNVTPLEPGWQGVLILEIANLSSLPLRVYVDMGIAQILFFRADSECGVSYGDRAGKYQGQDRLTHAKV